MFCANLSVDFKYVIIHEEITAWHNCHPNSLEKWLEEECKPRWLDIASTFKRYTYTDCLAVSWKQRSSNIPCCIAVWLQTRERGVKPPLVSMK